MHCGREAGEAREAGRYCAVVVAVVCCYLVKNALYKHYSINCTHIGGEYRCERKKGNENRNP